MSYTELFQRYGSPSDTADIRLTAYLTRPDKLDSFDRVRRFDDSAARMIADCKRTVSQLVEYRQALAARYNALATMPSRDSLELQRYASYSDKRITYYIRRRRTYEDGTSVEVDCESFSGKDRRAAFARFDALLKEHPGIEHTKDIERRPWER